MCMYIPASMPKPKPEPEPDFKLELTKPVPGLVGVDQYCC